MSAITGIFYRNGRTVPEEQIKKMNDRLSHRGPDGSSIWCEGPVGLGHQMLWTTPESLHETLPFEEDGLVITADARIDNRRELSKKLGIEDKEEVPDSYFILKAYQRWGEKCPGELLGDFAFAIWDKDKKKLFCARDHMGVKPFYYYLSDEGFFFATEIKAFFSIHNIPFKLNEMKIAFHLIPISEDRETTFYEGVLRLPAANFLNFDKNGIKISQYWQLNPDKELLMNSHEDYVEVFYNLFAEAVKCRLRTVLPTGFELSGGLDSSSIFCMAKELSSDKDNQLSTFSYKFNEISECDESYYVDKVCDKWKMNSHFLIADNISVLEDMNDIFWHIEEPCQTPNLCLYWNLLKMARKNDVRVLLSGEGGDTTLYRGEEYFKELLKNFKIKNLFREINGYSNHHNNELFKVFFNHVIFPSFPKIFRNKWLSYKNSRVEGDFLIINEDFENRLELKKLYKELHGDPFEKIKWNSKKFHYYDITHAYRQTNFELLDRIAATLSIELRFPLLDKRLIELCYAIPTEEKFRGGWDRILMRTAMENILPNEVQWRSGKITTAPMIKRNLVMFEKNRLIRLFNNKEIKKYVNLDEIENICKTLKIESEWLDVIDLWRFASLVIWFEKYKNNMY